MDTIIIYSRENSKASSEAVNWLKSNDLPVQEKNLTTITHREIFQLIYLAGIDIIDVLRDFNKYSFLNQKKKEQLKYLRFSECLLFLEKYPILLQDPIILSNKYALVGFDDQKLKYFLQ